MSSEIEFFLFHSSLVCTRCGETLLARRDCARCLQHFCYSCTMHHVLVYSKSQTDFYYVCDGCYSLLLLVDELMQQEFIIWNSLTPRGKQWMLASECPKEIHIAEYVNREVTPQDIDMIGKDVYSGRTSPNTFNWELHEVLARLHIPNFQDNVGNVLKAFCALHPEIGYCQGMNMVVVWLLLFLDEDSAFQLFAHLIESVLPPGFYSDSASHSGLNSFFLEATVISAVADQKIPSIRDTEMTASDFVDIFAIKLLIQLFVNALDIRSTIFIWDHLMEEGDLALTRSTLSLLVLCEKSIKAREHPAKILQRFEENRIGPQLRMVYSEIALYVTRKRVDRLKSHAKVIRSKQWRENKPVILKRLEQCSNFTIVEIERFQEEFNRVLKARFEAKRSSGWKRLKHMKSESFSAMDRSMSDKMVSFNEELEPGFSREEFISMIRLYRPYLLELSDRLFDLYDVTQSGFLDFKELISFLSVVLKGSFEERLRLIFDLFSVKESGVLTAQELTHLIGKVMKLYRLGLDFGFVSSDKIVEHVDLRILTVLKNDWVTKKPNWTEFSGFVLQDQILTTCFMQYFAHVFSQDLASPATMIQAVGAIMETDVSPYKEEDYSPILPDDPALDQTQKCVIC